MYVSLNDSLVTNDFFLFILHTVTRKRWRKLNRNLLDSHCRHRWVKSLPISITSIFKINLRAFRNAFTQKATRVPLISACRVYIDCMLKDNICNGLNGLGVGTWLQQNNTVNCGQLANKYILWFIQKCDSMESRKGIAWSWHNVRVNARVRLQSRLFGYALCASDMAQCSLFHHRNCFDES